MGRARVGAAPDPSPAPHSTAPLPPRTEGQVHNLAELIAALVQSPNVQATVAPSPATVDALEHTNAEASHLALAGLRTLAASPTHHLLAEPYVPINLSALSEAGVSAEITGRPGGPRR